MNKRQNEIRKFFNQAAEKYNKDRTFRGGRLFNEFIEIPSTLKLVGEIDSNASVLDIGCGIGSYSYYFGELGCEVTGIDISEKMIGISKSKCIKLKNVSFINSSFKEFASTKKYDVIVGGFMLGYFENLEETFKKIDESLSEDGIAVLSMLHPVRLSSVRRTLFSYEIGNYFDEKYYKTDLNMDFGEIELRKWNVEDIFLNLRNTNIYVDQIREPIPVNWPNKKFIRQDILFYLKNPSVIVFKFKKK
jgi:2-polyprenyl-3-methyl-5-hydroxy-6-metoxy-1,4-benzoquinol methylase